MDLRKRLKKMEELEYISLIYWVAKQNNSKPAQEKSHLTTPVRSKPLNEYLNLQDAEKAEEIFIFNDFTAALRDSKKRPSASPEQTQCCA
ncbi:hypothetical protein TNCT_422761 [Trichonephila clavata]|uniref:Uncharacterized protein n=1 Tax=Trichonephila clavata TaxID=2740835 RepID=A0A8X6LZI5_TRICU|nr:hypothetical protein TNCT_422761 [Trichonephila clavata]